MMNLEQLHDKYIEIIKQFVTEEDGVILIYSDDSIVIKLLRNMFSFHLQLKGDYLRLAKQEGELFKDANQIREAQGKALFCIERTIKTQNNSHLIRHIKAAYPTGKMIVLTNETERDALVYMHEIGADNFLVKPVSVKSLIEKLASTISPQGQVSKLVQQGKDYLQRGAYEEARGIAEEILALKPNSPVALMIMGDALNQMGRENEALRAYLAAADHARLYLEPIKRIVEYFKDKNDKKSQLEYLEKLESLSPLNVERKIEIGEIHMSQGRSQEAEKYFQEARDITVKQAKSMVDNITLTMAEICMRYNPSLAERYFREIIESKTVLTDMDVHVFNRLGIALRKQGKWEQAINEFKKVIKVAKDAATIYSI